MEFQRSSFRTIKRIDENMKRQINYKYNKIDSLMTVNFFKAFNKYKDD